MDILNASMGFDPTPARKWSDRQEAIFDATRLTSNNLQVNAVAGSGKTTTLIKCTEFTEIPTIYLAFAKANKLDLQAKLPDPKMAQTLNGMGHGIWMRQPFGARLDADKLEKICVRLMPTEKLKKYGYIVRRIISTAKQTGLGMDHAVSPASFNHFITEGDWDIDDKEVEEVAQFCWRVFQTSVSDFSTFDFDDQIFGPIYHGWKFPRYATVLVDEWQDLNALQHAFVDRLAEQGARIIAVGDPFQSIYAFRGALHDSMEQGRRRFNMVELPLDVSYRCSQQVIAEAQQLVPHIKARDGAPTGAVLDQRVNLLSQLEGDETKELELRDPELFPSDWLIICRNNAPLFAAVMRHVRARKPCRVLSNALDGLASFIKRFRTDEIKVLRVKVTEWLEKETQAAEAKGMPWKVAALEDKANTVFSLCEGPLTVSEVLNTIRQLSEGRSGPLFATIHKAKGLEAPHTYLLRPDLLPGWWVEKAEDLQQEANLKYVAITRAQETFTYGIRKERRK